MKATIFGRRKLRKRKRNNFETTAAKKKDEFLWRPRLRGPKRLWISLVGMKDTWLDT
jgi:hypothetical protein